MKKIFVLSAITLFTGASSFAQPSMHRHHKSHKHHKHMMKHGKDQRGTHKGINK